MFISLFDYHILARFTGVLYAMAAASMILVRTPLGTVSNGARRWLKIGPIQFQPAEIAKIAGDRLSFLYDRSYGEEDEFTQGLYDTWADGYLSCKLGICLYR